MTAFHEVSVYPKKELPFFIVFTAGLCSFTALLALLTHQYPEPMGYLAKTVSHFHCLAILTHQYLQHGIPRQDGQSRSLRTILTHQYSEPMGFLAKTVSHGHCLVKMVSYGRCSRPA